MEDNQEKLSQFQSLQAAIEEKMQQDTNFDEIISLLNEANNLKVEIEKLQKDNSKTIQNIQEKFISQMKLQNMESIEHEGIRYSWAEMKFYSVLKNDKDKFFEWLEKIGHEDLIKIKKDVHYQTMNGFFRNEFEGELPEMVKVHVNDILSTRKKNK